MAATRETTFLADYEETEGSEVFASVLLNRYVDSIPEDGVWIERSDGTVCRGWFSHERAEYRDGDVVVWLVLDPEVTR